MKKLFKVLMVVILFFILGYFILGYTSTFIGWYGYKKWKNRASTLSIEESKKRGVFVMELNYKIDSFSGVLKNFRPYIEKGFRYGYRSSRETRELVNSQYPYQLSFNYRPTEKITILIKPEELKKFDSANNSWGYLKSPYLSDTIILDIGGENIRSGLIKVW